ncbi:MAG: tetratricopeptide repeat protein, partial [Myxococcota bacterium]
MNKQKILAAAQKYVSKGNLSRAVREYERILDADPGDLRVRLKVGDLQAKQGNVDAAIEAFDYVARAHANMGFMLKAVAVYKRIIQISPENVTILTRLAEAYLQQGLMSDAMAYYNAVAQIMVKQNDPDGYVRTLLRMLEVDPSNVGIRIKLAEHFSKEGNNAQAVEHFSQAAEQLKSNGRIDDYVKVAERLIFHQPEALDRIKELVQVYLDRGDARRALAKLQLCFKSNPNDPHTLGLLVQVFLALEQNDKAIQVLREKAKAHTTLQQEDEARATWQQLLQHIPDDKEATEALNAGMLDSDLLAPISTGEFQALKDAQVNPFEQQQAAPVAHPSELYQEEDPEVQRLLVETDVYIKYSLFDQATEHLTKVFALAPNNLDAMERLKEIYFQQGYYPQAVDELLRMAQICVQADWERSVSYLKEALQIMPHNEAAQTLLQHWGLTWEQLFPAVASIPEDAFPDLASVDAIMAEQLAGEASMMDVGAEPISNDAALTGQFMLPEDLEERFEEHLHTQELMNELDELNIQEIEEDELVSIDVDLSNDDITSLAQMSDGAQFDGFHDDTTQFSFDQQAFDDRAPTGDPSIDPQLRGLPQDLALDLAESDFYFKQGLYDEARSTLSEIMNRWPAHPAVLQRIQALADAIEASATPHTPLPQPHNSASTITPQASVHEGGYQPPYDGVLNESALPMALYEDPEMSGHFELGLAFREMGLYQDAVNEFQEACQAGQEIAQSLFWMGQCYLENNDAQQAIALFEQSSQYVHTATELLLHIDYRIG